MLTKYWQSWQVCFIHSNWCVQCILPILRPENKYVYIVNIPYVTDTDIYCE